MVDPITIKNNQNMKTIIRTFVCLGVLVAAASCQLYHIDTQMTPEKAAAGIRMVCDALPSYTAPASRADAISFTVSSNTPWTITRSNGADWCTVTPSSSASSSLISNVVVTLDDNPDGTDRTATLTLRGDNIAAPVTIQITQSRQGRLFVTPIAKDFVAAGGPLSFTLNTNQDWTVRSDVSWLHFNRESGTPDPDGRTITIIATADPSDVLERIATVTVSAGDDEESFEIAQVGRFELTEAATEFSDAGGSQTMKLRTDLPWTVSADKNWVTVDPAEGTGDGSSVDITLTAAPNSEAARKAVITVTAGDAVKTFEVSQAGAAFEIVTPDRTELDGKSDELILEVNTALDWNPATDVEGWAVEKIDASHFKLTAGWNSLFVPKKGKVSITGAGGAQDELELTQDMNFTFSGHTEMLEDGSVKVYEDEVSGIFTKDDFQYVIMDVDVEMHLGAKGSFTMCTEHYSDGYEYELQLNLQRTDAFRLRSNGGKVTTRGAKEFTFDKTKLDAMTHAQIQFVPNAEDPTMIDQSFYWNGEKQDKVLVSTSVFAAEPTLAGNYFVGSIKAADDGSYFIIKSCTITPVE